jgi:hypothetical protein
VPENTDTRLTRVEEQLKGAMDDLKVLWPLPAQYAVQEERLSGLRKDLNEGLAAIRDEIAEMKTTSAERAKERRTMLIALFVAGVGLFGTFVATAVPLIRGNPDPPVREQTR